MTTSLKEAYPKTGQYREDRETIEDHVAGSIRELKKRGNNYTLREMFALSKEGAEELTPDEKEDVWNFMEYAGKRLTQGQMVSPEFHGSSSENRSPEEVMPAFALRHDTIHAMVAYSRNHSDNSLKPAFQKMDQEHQYSDPEALQEECMTLLWDKGDFNFVYRLLKTGDFETSAMIAFRNIAPPTPDGWTELRQYAKDISNLKETDPTQYILLLHEKVLLVSMLAQEGSKGMGDKIRKSFETFQANRYPEYVNAARALYENSQAEKPDPKILFNEFRRILEPLLKKLRLRKKAGIAIE